jgi:anti-sigma factor RsiW
VSDQQLRDDQGDGLTEDLLSAYLDDELDAVARAEVDDRLATSPEWRAILDEVRATRDALRALPAVDGSPEFWARMMVGDQVVDLAKERRRRSVPRWAVAAAGAAAAAVIVVGVVAVPQEQKVRPAVATFTDEHAARSSVDNDVISSLASVGVPTRLGK